MARRRPLLCAGLLALTLAVTACGGDDASPTATDRDPDAVVTDADGRPADLVAASPDRLAEERSARMTMTMTMRGLPGMADVEVRADGVIDLVTQDSLMTMDMGSLGALAGIPPEGLELRVVDGVTYMPVATFGPALGALGIPPGVEWVSVDLTEAGGQLGLSGASDLTSYLEQLRAVSSEVETVGTEEIEGAATRHYRAHIDLGKAAAEIPDDVRALLGGAGDDALAMLEGWEIPVDVWLDADGLPRRTEMHFDFSDLPGMPPDAQDVSMEMRMELSDFGVEVDVEAPPDREVFDITTFLSGTALAS